MAAVDDMVKPLFQPLQNILHKKRFLRIIHSSWS